MPSTMKWTTTHHVLLQAFTVHLSSLENANSPVSCKAQRMLRCLIEVAQYPGAIWRP